MRRIPTSRFQLDDTLEIARQLIGMRLCTLVDGDFCSGIISETEAYLGKTDRASHAYAGRRTQRTETMYALGGHAYVYLCYGIHDMFNIVCGQADNPQAILIRAIIPEEGLKTMYARCNKSRRKGLCDGPGKVCKAMGIHRAHDGILVNKVPIWLEENPEVIPDSEISIGPRIGIDYAGEDALLPYRFLWRSAIV